MIAASSSDLLNRRSIGVAKVGAPAAAQNALTISITDCGSGLTRWKTSPSRFGRRLAGGRSFDGAAIGSAHSQRP